MAHARVLAAPPIGVAFLLSLPLFAAMTFEARAERAPVAIKYSKPMQMAALDPAKPVLVAKQARGPLTAYGYGATAAPTSGPALDLRGAFSETPVTAPRVSFVPPPVIPQDVEMPAAQAPIAASGPLDIRPPMPKDGELLGAVSDPIISRPLTTPIGAPPVHGAYLVQVGAFSILANAERTRDRAAAVGAVLMDTLDRPAGPLYRVRVGSFSSRGDAEAARASIVSLGFADARVTQAD